MIALFEVDILPTNVSNAVSIILSNPNVIPGLKTLSVNINSRSYEVIIPTQTTTKSNNEFNLPGVIVGIVAACIVVGLITYFIYRKIKSKSRPRSNNNEKEFQRIDESIDENPSPTNNQPKPIENSQQYLTPPKSKSMKSKPKLSSPTIVEDIE